MNDNKYEEGERREGKRHKSNMGKIIFSTEHKNYG
jgi:hypothetical protein